MIDLRVTDNFLWIFVDINECSTANGDCSQTCVNLNGTYHCSCQQGYYLYNGSEGMVPEATVNRTCLGMKCPTPPVLQNGAHAFVGRRFPNHVTSECNNGYIRIGQERIQCLETGNWSAPFPRCDAVNCGDPGALAHGTRNITDGFNYQSVVSYYCSAGYMKVSGSDTMECVSNKTHAFWTGSFPVCTRKDCARLPALQFGKLTYKNGTLFGDKVLYDCNPGYNFTGNKEIVCQANGQWSGTNNNICTAEACPDPGVPKNGQRVGSLYVGGIVRYNCIPGYYIQGNVSSTCKYANGTGKFWTGVLPECIGNTI